MPKVVPNDPHKQNCGIVRSAYQHTLWLWNTDIQLDGEAGHTSNGTRSYLIEDQLFDESDLFKAWHLEYQSARPRPNALRPKITPRSRPIHTVHDQCICKPGAYGERIPIGFRALRNNGQKTIDAWSPAAVLVSVGCGSVCY